MKESKSILCIDDDEIILEIFSEYFEENGNRAFVAENGEVGLQKFYQYHPDIVLVDLNMPVIDGFEVIKKITADSPETPIIVISGEGEMSDVIQALHIGAWHYMVKPIVNYDILDHAIAQAFEKADLIRQNKSYQKGLEQKLGSIVEQFPGFVFSCNNEFRITYANPRLQNYCGIKLIGEYCFKAIFGQDSVQQWCSWPVNDSHEPFQIEIKNPKDQCWYDMTVLPIVDQDKQIVEYQIVLYDITKQKQELQEAEERAHQLQKENEVLLASLKDRFRFGKIIGKSPAMQEVYRTIIDAAASDASVVIYGESGTGKELVAQSIHETSGRADGPFICVNCGAIPEDLIESEFFGYKKGAFSGAGRDKYGFLDIANGGTLFLDEVGDIPLNMQVKLLRAVEGGGFTPLGGNELSKPNIRIISATHRDLTELVRQGKIRQDFLYRIHVIPISLPSLKEREGDLRLLIDHFFQLYDPEGDKILTSNIRKALHAHPWPGNVRELQNTIHRYVTLGKLDFLNILETDENKDDFFDVTELPDQNNSLAEVLEEVEKQVIIRSFERYGWHQGRTADALKIDRKTLYRKMKTLNIVKEQ